MRNKQLMGKESIIERRQWKPTPSNPFGSFWIVYTAEVEEGLVKNGERPDESCATILFLSSYTIPQ